MASVALNITPVNEPVLNDGAHQLKFSADVAWNGVTPNKYRYKVFRGDQTGTLLFDSGFVAAPTRPPTTTWPQMTYTIPAAEATGAHLIMFRLYSTTAIDWDADLVAGSYPPFQVAAKGTTTASVVSPRAYFNSGSDSVSINVSSSFSGSFSKRRIRLLDNANAVITETYDANAVTTGASRTYTVPIPSGRAPGTYKIEVATYTAPSCLDGVVCAMPAQTGNYDSVATTATFQVAAPAVITQPNPTFSGVGASATISLAGGSIAFGSTPARLRYTLKNPSGVTVGTPVTDPISGASPLSFTRSLTVPASAARGQYTVLIEFFSTDSDAISATTPEASITRTVQVPISVTANATGVPSKALNRAGSRLPYSCQVSGWSSTPSRLEVRLYPLGSGTASRVNVHTMTANQASPFTVTSNFDIAGLAPGTYIVLGYFISSAGNPETFSSVATQVVFVAPGTGAPAALKTDSASPTVGIDYSFTLTYASTAIRADVAAVNVATGASVPVSSTSLPGAASPQTISGAWIPPSGTPSGRYQLVCSFYSQES